MEEKPSLEQKLGKSIDKDKRKTIIVVVFLVLGGLILGYFLGVIVGAGSVMK